MKLILLKKKKVILVLLFPFKILIKILSVNRMFGLASTVLYRYVFKQMNYFYNDNSQKLLNWRLKSFLYDLTTLN